MPAVRVSALGRHRIKLSLPSSAEGAIGPPGLDVLVATGLALVRIRDRRVNDIDRFEKFTERARKALHLAQEEAQCPTSSKKTDTSRG